ncbi:hypothetical protein GJAV_G00118080 [Gymnothorax javanicus]|nr:hypothetical protein GJAV_G00118080 [Gymnothorax javanicus]
MLPYGTTGKRKRCSAGSESNPAKRCAVNGGSPMKRKSPRLPQSPLGKKGHVCEEKENFPSPQKSACPRRRGGSPTCSPLAPRELHLPSSMKGSPKRASPFKPSVATGCFYSKKKALYLTPLERKLVKDTKPLGSKSVSSVFSPPKSVERVKPRKQKKPNELLPHCGLQSPREPLVFKEQKKKVVMVPSKGS